jgi:uncharacterized protein YndB with AHSA1/START domain
MRIASHTIWIARPPDSVFDYFVDFSKASRWRSYVRTMVHLDQGPLAAGSHIHVVLDVLGEAQEIVLEVLDCNRPSLWRHRTDEVDFLGQVEYRFEPEENGTRVTLTITAKPVGMYGWLAVPLVLLRRNRPYAEQLPQLKRAMET